MPTMPVRHEGTLMNSDPKSILFKNRTIIMFEEFNDKSAESIIIQLLALDAESHGPIYIIINSPGGSVYACLSIVDVIGGLKSPVYTVGCGLVASAAMVLFAVGAKGHRYTYKHTTFLLHQPSGGARGTATDTKIQIDEMLRLKESLSQLIYTRLNSEVIKYEELYEMAERDKYLKAEEAIKIGLADHIVVGNFDNKVNA